VHARTWLLASAVLLTAGCAAEKTPVAMPAVEPVTIEMAAASSGGACRLLDYAVIAKHTGGKFDVAAAVDKGDTHTCVIRAEQALLPELTLTLSDTSIDASGFSMDVLPRGAKKISKLGKIAYRRTVPKSGKLGPAAEVGWLAAEGRLVMLRWTCPPGTATEQADKLATKLIELGKVLDTRKL
jgi:hypothetical protein